MNSFLKLIYLGIMLVVLTSLGWTQKAETRVLLISSASEIELGKSMTLGIHLQMPQGWHTYWKNAGDSGIPTEVVWTLPQGFRVSELRWPIPHRIEAPPLTTFGYEEEVVLLATLTAPASFQKNKFEISAKVRWLECRETCIPGETEVKRVFPIGKNKESEENPLIEKFERLVPQETVAVSAEVFSDKTFQISIPVSGIQKAEFFPQIEGKFKLEKPFSYEYQSGRVTVRGQLEGEIQSFSGVLVGDRESHLKLWTVKGEMKQGVAPSLESKSKSLLQILLFAFVGGLILNLMPCVLPVLSLKIMGFVHEAQQEGSQVWKQGAAFTTGVLISFWILTAILIGLRFGGEGVGWGFQLQSPGFVLAMLILFLLMTLNLFGVFEVGTSLTALQNNISHRQGLMKSFGSGVLATIVATPCSAPFMGVAVGYALSQSAFTTFLVMTFLGMGVAAPYFILSLKPNWIRKIPKPGEWMIVFRQFLGFLMLGAVLWLIWVYAQLQGIQGLGSVLGMLMLLSFAIWGWTRSKNKILKMVALFFGIFGIYQSIPVTHSLKWEAFSKNRVEQLRAEGKPVFIDFTAAWCLSCQVNKKLVLEREEIQKVFQEKGVVVLRADWTNRDSEITEALASYGRASVPVYVLYGRNKETPPQILPEVLTKEIILESLRKMDSE